MKRIKTITVLVLAVLLLTGCERPADNSTDQTESANTAAGLNPTDLFTDRDYQTEYHEEAYASVTFSENEVTADSDAVKISGTKVEIVEAGTYVLSGILEDGQIIVNTEKTDKVRLVLNGVQISSATSAPVYILQADKVFITTAKDTENALSNGGVFEAVDDNNIDAAVFSKEDVTFNGEGSLHITSPAGHGIVSKDDLVITGGSYHVICAYHGICGKESVRIDGGVFDLTAGKDGIHAENSENTDLGYCYIGGGMFTVTAAGDGIAASAGLEIADGDFTVTAGGGSENADKSNSENYGGFMGSGHGSMGRPGSWGRSSETAVDSESTSMKGIKAAADLTVRGGRFVIDSADDAVHSNANIAIIGGSFSIATGDDGFHADERLDIFAGTVTVTESYEGLEGQHITVHDGEISLTASDDGLNAAGGTDSSGMGGRDQMFGVGMGGGMSSGNGSITICGGKLYVQASGDGIDANGTLEITGGYTVVCGPTQGDTATLDYDKTAVISGGTFIGTGASGMAQTFSDSKDQGVIAVQVGSAAAGTEIVLQDSEGNVILSVTPQLSYNVVILSSPHMVKGESYTLSIGTQSKDFQAN